MAEYRKGAHTVYDLKYHLVWVTKYRYPALRKRYWERHLWARGYFCASSGTVTDEMIKAYIEQQKAPPDDGFSVDGEAQ